MNKYILLLVVLTATVFSQSECDGERYMSDLFPDIQITSNIEYGENITEDILGFEYTQTLYLDVYEPEGDNVNERPLIIFMFGGAFVSGSKNSPVMQELCTRYAKMGYVASAIDYRLTPTLIWNGSEENAYKAVLKAIHDLKAAIRYFRMNDSLYDDFGVDTSRIYTGGSSAGAIASVNTAYLNEESEIPELVIDFVNESGGLEGLSGNPGFDSHFYGIVNLCGAVGDTNWIEFNDIPIVSVHGDEDTVVPYADDLVTLFGINLQVYGSYSIHQTMIDLGNQSALYTFEGEDHTPYAYSDAYMDVTIDFTKEYMYDLVCAESQSEEISIYYEANWNLVGLPLDIENASYTTLFPESIEGTLYSFSGGYNPETILIHGEGYWLRFNEAGSTTITGTTINELTISLNEGWNLVSGLSEDVSIYSVSDPDSIIVPGTLYGFNEGYVGTDMLVSGNGYWVRAFEEGEITLTSGALAKTSPKEFSLKGKANNLTVNNTDLYFGVEMSAEDRLSYSLPPKPPAGAFDVRFSGNWKYCEDSGVIEVMNPGETLVIEYNVKEGELWELVPVIANGTEWSAAIPLSDQGQLTLGSGVEQWILRKSVSTVSTTFALHPAYPNPFNPITSLRYGLTEQAQVTLTIYDLIGREVTQLINTTQEAGYRSVQWDATNMHGKPVSAGVYLYQIQAGEFVQTRKMVLLK